MAMMLVDTREQKPLWLESKSCKKQKLDVGDYTSEDLLNIAHAERKSPQDLYSTITHGHSRFKNEILLAKQRNIQMTVFVECSSEMFYSLKWNHSGARLRIKPNTLAKIIGTIKKKYGIDFIWCNDREHMRFKIKQWLSYNRSLDKTELQLAPLTSQ